MSSFESLLEQLFILCRILSLASCGSFIWSMELFQRGEAWCTHIETVLHDLTSSEQAEVYDLLLSQVDTSLRIPSLRVLLKAREHFYKALFFNNGLSKPLISKIWSTWKSARNNPQNPFRDIQNTAVTAATIDVLFALQVNLQEKVTVKKDIKEESYVAQYRYQLLPSSTVRRVMAKIWLLKMVQLLSKDLEGLDIRIIENKISIEIENLAEKQAEGMEVLALCFFLDESDLSQVVEMRNLKLHDGSLKSYILHIQQHLVNWLLDRVNSNTLNITKKLWGLPSWLLFQLIQVYPSFLPFFLAHLKTRTRQSQKRMSNENGWLGFSHSGMDDLKSVWRLLLNTTTAELNQQTKMALTELRHEYQSNTEASLTLRGEREIMFQQYWSRFFASY
ncbi:hypothetical protein K7432_009924 [Basidiobolus ranarum]|uniref:Uncharacterized protein n=1 Tax=Basidiobolus ranarum TaxID=34480 RepID=A0ABR2WPM1_9FUNG